MAKRSGKNGATKPKPKKGGRKSKAESVTGAKENEVEVSAVLDLKPIEVDEKTFDTQYKAMRALEDQKKRVVGLLRSQRKQLKECGPEVQESVLDALAMDGKDDEEVKRELQVRAFVLKKRESPVQISLHNMLLGDVNEVAYRSGYKDGEAGKPANSPYPEGSDLDGHYQRGWRHGMAKNAGVSAEDADKAVEGDDGGDSDKLWNDAAPHLTGAEQTAGTA